MRLIVYSYVIKHHKTTFSFFGMLYVVNKEKGCLFPFVIKTIVHD